MARPMRSEQREPSKLSPLLGDLTATLAELYPAATIKVTRVGQDASALRLVPNTRRPRMAVTASPSSAAAQALLRPSASDTFRTAAPRRLLSALLSRGLGPLLMPYGLTGLDPADSIADYLAEVLGHRVLVSLTVGSARANRKPILNVHRDDGVEIGFAKVGLNDLTNQLVHHEGQTLGRLAAAGTPTFEAPRTIHSGQWQGHEVLLMSALRPDVPQRQLAPLTAAAAGIIATAPIYHSTIGDSAWASGLGHSTAALRRTNDGDLPVLLDQFLRLHHDTVIPFGAWHGDFGPWNLAHTSALPMIWDWERYALDVPAGMDVVHYQAHRALRQIGNVAAARNALEESAMAALSKVLARTPGVNTPTPAALHAIVIGYLLTIATRFTLDARTPSGGPIKDLARWHRTVIYDQLQRGLRTTNASQAAQL